MEAIFIVFGSKTNRHVENEIQNVVVFNFPMQIFHINFSKT